MAHKVNLSCYMNPKIWAMMMALKNLALGICIIIGGSLWITHNKVLDTFKTYFACGIFLGILNIIAGCVLITALIQGKETIVLLYILLEFVNLFTLTIFAAMNNISPEFSVVFFSLLILCLCLWIGLYNVYSFYVELEKYNNSSVQAGVDEITCNTRSNPLVPFPEKALDSTTV